ncbi:MAG: PAS domain-containing protein [Rhodospirillales bacterium]|nr:PAS domain-containing protein [Rhodospirillales bacterium]
MLYISPAYESVWGRSCQSLLASPSDWIDAIHPEDRPRFAADLFEHMTLGRGEIRRQLRIVRPDGSICWIYDRSFPIATERGRAAAGIATDITDRKRAEAMLRLGEEQKAFLVRLGDALRLLTDPDEARATAARLLAEHLDADRTYYADIDEIARIAEVRPDYTGQGMPSLAGRYDLTVHLDTLAILRSGRALVVDDVETAPELSEAARAVYRQYDIGAFITVGLVKRDRLAWALIVMSRTARRWTRAETSLVVDRTR